jgi:signal transduction histidine kinase
LLRFSTAIMAPASVAGRTPSIPPTVMPYRPWSIAASTSVGVRRAGSRVRLAQMKDALEHPRLLPILVPDPDADRTRRSTRDWIVDVLCFLLAVVGGLAVFAEAEPRMSEGLIVVDLLLGGAACLAVWLRRRWPVQLAVVLGTVGVLSSSAAFAGLIALFTVAVHRRAAVAIAVAALTLVFAPAYIALHPDPRTPYAVELALGVLFTVAVVAWGMFVRARRQLVLSLRDRAERAEAEQHLRVDQARRQERARIAREMHDVLAHRISLLSLHAGALEFRPDAPPDEVARAAGVIRRSAHEALQDLRAVIGVLREGQDGGAPERPQPTIADLPALIAESRDAGVHVSYEVGELAAVPEATGRNAYRIVQEALTNARKHAAGAAVDVAVEGDAESGLTIEVRNRLPVGAATRPEIPGAGTGIVGLAERASLAGGRLEHGRTADGDYRLWAWLPWTA